MFMILAGQQGSTKKWFVHAPSASLQKIKRSRLIEDTPVNINV